MYARTGSTRLFPSTVWRDLVADMTRAPSGGGVRPTFTAWRSPLKAWTFASGAPTSDYVFTSYHIDHDYAPGTLAYFHVHTCPATAGQTGYADWEVSYSIARGHNQASSAFPAVSTVTLRCTTSATQYQHQITEDTGGISLLEPDSLLHLAIRRLSATDTCNGSQLLLFVDVHYQADRYGTQQKAPPWDT